MSTTPAPTRTDLLKTLDEIHEKARVTVEKRNAAYAGAGDVFGNLNLIETLSNGKVSTEAGIVIRMADKISRLWSLVQEGAPESDEKLEDTLQDLLGYSSLLLLRRRTRTPSCSTSPLATDVRAGRWASNFLVRTCPVCKKTILAGGSCCRVGATPPATDVEESKAETASKEQSTSTMGVQELLSLLDSPGVIKDNKINLDLPIRIDLGFGPHLTLEYREGMNFGCHYVLRFDPTGPNGDRRYLARAGTISQSTEPRDSTMGNLAASDVVRTLRKYIKNGTGPAQRPVPDEEDPADGG